MGIQQITTEVTGLIGVLPQFIYIKTNDSFATVTAAGYLNHAVSEGYVFSENQMALISTSDSGVIFCAIDISSGNYSLVLYTAGGNGDVFGPASATDNAFCRFNLATGKLIQNSGVICDDSNNITGVNDLFIDNTLLVLGSTFLSTTTLSQGASLIFENSDNTFATTVTESLTPTESYTIYWPPAGPTLDGQIFTGNMDGTTSWTTPSSGGGLNWVINSSPTVTIVPGTGYMNTESGARFTLPASPTLGDTFEIRNVGGTTASFQIQQNAGQQVQIASGLTTVGVSGIVYSITDSDCISLTYSGVSNRWIAGTVIGNLDVV